MKRTESEVQSHRQVKCTSKSSGKRRKLVLTLMYFKEHQQTKEAGMKTKLSSLGKVLIMQKKNDRAIVQTCSVTLTLI